MIKNYLFFFVLFSSLSWSQDTISKVCKGKIITDSNQFQDIHIINLRTERGSVSSKEGYFTIRAQKGDTLVFSAVHLVGLELFLNDENWHADLLIVKMENVTEQFEEVIVQAYPNINAVSLGIIPKGQKSYTPAERRYRTASNSSSQLGLNTSFSADPLLNMLSGRTAMLKKALETEAKEILIAKIKTLFDDAFLAQKLSLPLEYLNGFRFFIVEDANFINSIKRDNRNLATFLIGELAEKYKNSLLNEQK